MRFVQSFFPSNPNHEDGKTHSQEPEPGESKMKSTESIQENDRKTLTEGPESGERKRKIDESFQDNDRGTHAEGPEPGERKRKSDKSIQDTNFKKQRKESLALGQASNQSEDNAKITEENIKQLFSRLNLKCKLQSQDFLQVTSLVLQRHEPCEERNLVQTFIQQLLMMDYRARYIQIKERKNELNNHRKSALDKRESDSFEDIFGSKMHPLHPMDIQMAVFLHADHFFRQLIVTKLSQCQYAVPLLVTYTFNQKTEFTLCTFRQIMMIWKLYEKNESKIQPIYQAETHMIAFFRLSAVSTSKSQIMNNMINERHETFFHRHCRGSSKSRLLMDGVVEIAWYCPSGEKTDKFTDCVAFCNLHGDAQAHEKQLKFLTAESSINVVILPHLDRSHRSMTIVEELYKNSKPLICLLTEDESVLTEMRGGKYKIGLKDRNKFEVSEELRRTINECLSKTMSKFKLSDMVKHSEVKVDENDEDCKRAHELAKQMTTLLENNELSKMKETFLPCQGKLWHDWCQKNKELHQPQRNNIEIHNSQKQMEMFKIREKQKESGVTTFMKMFIEKLDSSNYNEKMFFIRWLGFLLDEYTSEDLTALHHKYDQKWSKVLDLKKNHDKSEQSEQIQLEKMSEKLNEATFGLEHLLREIGQIYESHESVKKNNVTGYQFNVSSFPQVAAELMVFGYPMELMDGDAAHVPLIWVKAVLDELIKILGEQRVFVLSVLGIQSTGKSTLLNAMFGLQFAVSADRCTRGAFMQLVKVSEELKEDLNFEYLLIVDTEGLRALELAGRSTRHHDNEVATFVVGLGNMTLISMFGENQDILQIVVQAFLRMKKVRLTPSCMFVHQNVGDVTADENNIKRRLQEKLDEMTQLTAEGEGCDVECFSDVIQFDIKSDVRHLDQLWEGSPPMAPPNPCYSENVQELKNAILSHASESNGVTLAQFRDRIGDLWNALLNENFIFSFKNTLDIAVYRALEEKCAKWTWSLRSAMLEIEDKLHNRINNRQLDKVESIDLENKIANTTKKVNNCVKYYFEEHKEKDILTQWRLQFHEKIKHLQGELVRDAKQRLDNIIYQRDALEKLVDKKTLHERKLLEKSKELAFSLKLKHLDENELKTEFDEVWEKWVSELAGSVRPFEDINIENAVLTFLHEIYGEALVRERFPEFFNINEIHDFTTYVNCIKNSNGSKELTPYEHASIEQLVHNIIHQTEKHVWSKSVAKMGYKTSYIQEIEQLVKKTIKGHLCNCINYEFKKEFTVDLMLFMCRKAGMMFKELHHLYMEANDPLIYLEKKKPEYYSVFQGFCRGATSAAIFGSLICNELKEPILQSVYNKTAYDLAGEMRMNIPAFKGNRSNLEKHILKTLAEKEDFYKFIEYIHYPRDHLEDFIKTQVEAYIKGEKSSALAILKANIRHKEHCVNNAAGTATDEVLSKRGDANMWLNVFSSCLKDELEFNKDHLTVDSFQIITDFELLEEVVKKELCHITEDLNGHLKNASDINMTMFRKQPDEILIEHFCKCCWVECPFCGVVCVNTIEGHPGDHTAPFHRNCGMTGMIYKKTDHLSWSVCTSAVASNRFFFKSDDSDDKILWRKYRTAGSEFASWCITPDLSELPYWKWFVCRFQGDLEYYYEKTFKGQIPDNWRSFTKKEALESLDKYICNDKLV
ncbi:interferon-induced very large GTPase 1-like [Misgurnus anguillicaudatus]|uniref:interferon-induced very large GTPase 1-like n=1 Tax=Misgurnus anguillicaudatus TaxID=75329 RepID=UPI003CCEFB26